MKRMNEFDTAMYHGFTLKKGYWYGTNLRGQYTASSGWISGEDVFLYTKGENGWAGQWVSIYNEALLGHEFMEWLLYERCR